MLRGFEDSSIKALMLSAAAEVRSCREVIREAGPERAGDLAACADRLDSLSDAIGRAWTTELLKWMDPDPVPSRATGRQAVPKLKRHLQVVGGDTA